MRPDKQKRHRSAKSFLQLLHFSDVVIVDVLGGTASTIVVFVSFDVFRSQSDTSHVEPHFAASITLNPMHFLTSRLYDENKNIK